MSWKILLRGCFGPVDRRFLSHRPLEEPRATKLAGEMREQGITLADVEAEVRAWMKSEGLPEEHIYKQIIQVRKFFGPFLRSRSLD